MHIEYEESKVKELFEDLVLIQSSRNLMRKLIGPELTKAVKKRYDQLKAASNFSIYLSTGLGKPHLLTGNMSALYGVFVTANWRLVIKPVSVDSRAESFKDCDTIIIKGVVDYHGKGSNNNWLIP